MDANLPRWIFQSIASHFQLLAADLSLPFLVEGIDERSDETMHSDHVELRVTGPTVKEISRDYYDTNTVINCLFTKAMNPVDTNAYDLIQWTGAFASAMLDPIPIYKKGSGADDDGSFISCLRIAKDKKEAARVYHFGQLDKDTPVRQSEVDAVFSMDYYPSLIEAVFQSISSILILTSSAEGDKLLNHSAETTMNLTSGTVVDRDLLRPIETTINLTSGTVVDRDLLRPIETTMSLSSGVAVDRDLLRPIETTMNLTDTVTKIGLMNISVETTMTLNSTGAGIIPDTSFRSTWNTSNTSAGSSNTVQVALPLVSDGTYNFVVEWGDSMDDTITAYGDAAKVHTYNSSGNYTINITGEIQGWQFADTGDKLKISNISNWGALNLASPTDVAEDNFYGCTNLTISSTDAIDLTDVDILDSVFRGCSSLASGGTGMDT